MPCEDLVKAFARCREDLAGGAITLEAAVRVNELAHAMALQAIRVGSEVPQAGRIRRGND
jgi:hypothetical protein